MPLIFPNRLVHSDVAKANERSVHRSYRGKAVAVRTVSAGFITFNKKCYGKSESLNLTSRPDLDTELVSRYFAGLES